MKVGILTHHWLYNFGANLQALATQNCLQSLGHEAVILNYRPPKLVERYNSLVEEKQIASHASFRDQLLNETPICANVDEVIDAADHAGLTTVVSGSDAVLRLDPAKEREDLNFPNPYWLNWAIERDMRTGFLAASSMGSNYLGLPSKTRAAVGKLLPRLNYIGLRDNWTRFMLSTCNRSAALNYCPDPVSVFNEVVPDDLCGKPTDEDYVLVSLYENTVNQSWQRQFVERANAEGLKVYSLPHPEFELEGPFDRVLRLPMSPLQWYAWLKHAKGYVGVRFHPIMISIVNQVPFVALDQYETALRFKHRLMTKLATAMILPWRRHTSKTYDLARRAGKVKYCLNRRMYRIRSATEVFNLLREQWDEETNSDFSQFAKKTFPDVLTRIIGD